MAKFETAKEAEAAARAFDLKQLPADFIDDPYPYYHALREHDPVHRMPDGSYIITRYDDCETLYKDAKTYSSDKKIEFHPKYGDSPLFEHHTTSLVFNDPPLHTHVRRAIAGALSPRAIAEMEVGLIELVDRLLDSLERKGQADLIEDFASAIPVEII
ncbi:MAG: cytochrome P450, partial [Pseudorhodoplanes sp.]